jgi:hypothetical protein
LGSNLVRLRQQGNGLLEFGEARRENVEIEIEEVETPCPVREQCDQKAASAGQIAGEYANAFEGIRPTGPYFRRSRCRRPIRPPASAGRA